MSNGVIVELKLNLYIKPERLASSQHLLSNPRACEVFLATQILMFLAVFFLEFRSYSTFF